MNLKISQSQLEKIVEQSMGGGFSPQYQSGEMAKIAKEGLNHSVSAVLEILTAFIPVVGPFISAGVGLMDASQYVKEGDNTTGAIVGSLSMLPFMGPVVTKIPGVKTLGSKGMAALGEKLAKKQKNFTPVEQEVLKGLSQNSDLVQRELRNKSLKMGGVAREVAKLKPAYIERLGQDSYEKLLKNFMRGNIDKETFIKSLTYGGKAQPSLANFMVKEGVKFIQQEVRQIEDIAKQIFEKNYSPKKLVLYKYNKAKMPTAPVEIPVIPISRESVKVRYPKVSTNVNAFVSNDVLYYVPESTVTKDLDDLVSLITHESAHIKDPSMAKSPKLTTSYKQGTFKAQEAAREMAKLQKGTPEYNKFLKQWHNYYRSHPWELVANNAMVLNNLTTQTQRLLKTYPKAAVMQGLDEVIDFITKRKTNMSIIGKKMLLGPEVQESMISAHLDYLGQFNKPALKSLLDKVVRQADYLKSQVKVAK